MSIEHSFFSLLYGADSNGTEQQTQSPAAPVTGIKSASGGKGLPPGGQVSPSQADIMTVEVIYIVSTD